MKDASKAKYIIGNMVIPVNDEIKAELKGDYTPNNLVQYVKNNPKRIMFMMGTVNLTDNGGLVRWNLCTHPDRITDPNMEHLIDLTIEHINESLHKIECRLGNLEERQHKGFARIESTLWGSKCPKPSLFHRIFKRKKL